MVCSIDKQLMTISTQIKLKDGNEYNTLIHRSTTLDGIMIWKTLVKMLHKPTDFGLNVCIEIVRIPILWDNSHIEFIRNLTLHWKDKSYVEDKRLVELVHIPQGKIQYYSLLLSAMSQLQV